ncbi:MAG: zinc ribbon domain-containing protein [Thermodesulfobacteriota bacterium]|nr:zinc ribbon domain-containing protein [Thermodesulfobacteriota bacterium]
MPIYEYKCTKCSNVFEVLQKFSDAPIDSCPRCGGHVEKLVSKSSFHLKGSGWYLTDYGKKHSPKEATKPDTKPKKKKDHNTSKKDKD